jgi:hypothetical protein
MTKGKKLEQRYENANASRGEIRQRYEKFEEK